MLKPDAAARKDRTSGNGSTRLEHRHFAWLAATIRDWPVPSERAEMATYFADACTHTNPNFDRRRFLSACED